MIVAEKIKEMRQAVAEARARGEAVGLVPTMGALHDGHFSLIRHARAKCDFVVVSIFVNPLQFGPNEDLDAYPRTPDADLAACRARGVAAVFAPPVEKMYKRPCLTKVSVEEMSDRLCGASRPGHFTGVCTVVAKLFHIIQPDKAFFGLKDYQQTAILRRMVKDLSFPVKLTLCPTVREPDGVAMSSRNRYLTGEQRRQAPALWGSLQMAEGMILERQPPAGEVLDAIAGYISEHAPDADVEYIRVADPDSLADVERTEGKVLVALAVRLGRARLIDNVVVDPAATR